MNTHAKIFLSNGNTIKLKDYCANCHKKIIPNGIEPILFRSNYFHYDCTWDKKTIKSNHKNLKTKDEIKAWITKTKAEIINESITTKEILQTKINESITTKEKNKVNLEIFYKV